VYTHSGPVRLPEANTGAEALRASLGAPQGAGQQETRGMLSERPGRLLGPPARSGRKRPGTGWTVMGPAPGAVDDLSQCLSHRLSARVYVQTRARGVRRDKFVRQTFTQCRLGAARCAPRSRLVTACGCERPCERRVCAPIRVGARTVHVRVHDYSPLLSAATAAFVHVHVHGVFVSLYA
jgi:hypothetical protein